MPNQGNKSNGKSGIVQPKKTSTVPSKEKQGSEDNTAKHGNDANSQKGTGSSGKKRGND